MTIQEICKEYGFSASTIYQWIERYHLQTENKKHEIIKKNGLSYRVQLIEIPRGEVLRALNTRNSKRRQDSMIAKTYGFDGDYNFIFLAQLERRSEEDLVSSLSHTIRTKQEKCIMEAMRNERKI